MYVYISIIPSGCINFLLFFRFHCVVSGIIFIYLEDLILFLQLFLFLVEMGFTMLAKMVSISLPHDLPATASQSAGIIGVNHCI